MPAVIGSHVVGSDPFQGALDSSSEVVQVNLSAPRNWRPPVVRKDAARLIAWDVPLFVHAPYLVNPASLNPEVRLKSRNCLVEQLAAAEAVGARGLVVHGGHPTGSGTIQDGIDGWVEVLAGLQHSVPILIENTAGGKAAVARRLSDLALLWERLVDVDENVGVCLDTCHAHAGGEPLNGLVERTYAVTGRVDLVHVNDSKDPFDSSRDRHENLGKGLVGLDRIVQVVRDAAALGAPSLVETPGEGNTAQRVDVELLRSLV